MEKEKQLKIKKQWKKANIKITKKLRDIIHGYVMSNGYINKNGILQVEQSKKQEKFVLWLYHQLKLIVSSSGVKEQIRIHPKTKKKIF